MITIKVITDFKKNEVFFVLFSFFLCFISIFKGASEYFSLWMLHRHQHSLNIWINWIISSAYAEFACMCVSIHLYLCLNESMTCMWQLSSKKKEKRNTIWVRIYWRMTLSHGRRIHNLNQHVYSAQLFVTINRQSVYVIHIRFNWEE